MKRSSFSFALAIILVVIVSGSAAAETFLFKNIPNDTPTIGLRFLRPNFSHDTDLAVYSGIYDLMVNLPIDERWSIEGSLPYTWLSDGGNTDTETYIGNIYAGMQYMRKSGNSKSIISFGAYLPTAKDDLGHMIFGAVTNSENVYKYLSDTTTLTGNYAWFTVSDKGARLGLEIGPDVTLSSGEETEYLVHYGLTVGYRGEKCLIATELLGQAIISEDYTDFSDHFNHSIDFGASFISRRFVPSVFYKIYFDEDFTDLVDGVLGIKVELIM